MACVVAEIPDSGAKGINSRKKLWLWDGGRTSKKCSPKAKENAGDCREKNFALIGWNLSDSMCNANSRSHTVTPIMHIRQEMNCNFLLRAINTVIGHIRFLRHEEAEKAPF